MKPATVFLGEMTNPEVEAFLQNHNTVIVPIGATEQHGPHAPLMTDVLIPQEIAKRVAPRLGGSLAVQSPCPAPASRSPARWPSLPVRPVPGRLRRLPRS